MVQHEYLNAFFPPAIIVLTVAFGRIRGNWQHFWIFNKTQKICKIFFFYKISDVCFLHNIDYRWHNCNARHASFRSKNRGLRLSNVLLFCQLKWKQLLTRTSRTWRYRQRGKKIKIELFVHFALVIHSHKDSAVNPAWDHEKLKNIPPPPNQSKATYPQLP